MVFLCLEEVLDPEVEDQGLGYTVGERDMDILRQWWEHLSGGCGMNSGIFCNFLGMFERVGIKPHGI